MAKQLILILSILCFVYIIFSKDFNISKNGSINISEGMQLITEDAGIGNNQNVIAYTIDNVLYAYLFNNQIWKSIDAGRSWTYVKTETHLNRALNSNCMFNDKIYIFDVLDNNVGYSADGENFTYVSTTKTFYTGGTSFVINDKLWHMGGWTGSTRDDEIWSSADGITWFKETEETVLGGFNDAQSVSDGSCVYIMGGYWLSRGLPSKKVWKTCNGVDWELINSNPDFTVATDLILFSYNSYYFIYGGYNGTTIDQLYRTQDFLTFDNLSTNVIGKSYFFVNNLQVSYNNNIYFPFVNGLERASGEATPTASVRGYVFNYLVYGKYINKSIHIKKGGVLI